MRVSADSAMRCLEYMEKRVYGFVQTALNYCSVWLRIGLGRYEPRNIYGTDDRCLIPAKRSVLLFATSGILLVFRSVLAALSAWVKRPGSEADVHFLLVLSF
jgi:hypothetical protein